MLHSFWKNRQLIVQMTKREVISRYRGSIIGVAWSFFNPLLILLAYTFVFSVVFKARWGVTENESTTDFAIILFAGVIVFNLFAEIINRAPTLVISNVNYVKKVVFPLEILSWVALGSALFHTVVNLVVLLLVQLFVKNYLPWTSIFFPFVLLPLIFACLGISWLLSALGVYMRDIGQLTGVFTTVLMFFSAIFYPISALPEKYQVWLRLNPLVWVVSESRKVLVQGIYPDWLLLGILSLGGMLITIVGYWFFQKMRNGFADVI